MKKLILLAILLSFSLSSFSQRNDKEWFLSIGLNTVNHLGSQSPIYHPGDWVANFPISAAAEFSWSDDFSVEQSITFNAFNEGDDIDGRILKQDYNYLSLDTHLKYNFAQYLFPREDWLELYANAGFGFFNIDESNISANLGGGALFWLNRDRSFGIRAQIIGKFAFNHKDSGIDNNHYQYHLQAVFKL